MTNLIRRLNLAGACLLAWLDPDHDLLPTGGWRVSHDTGRWWDAILRVERTTGLVIPAELEGAMLANLDHLTDNPDGLLFVPPGLSWGKPAFELHSLREGLLAMNALVRFRNSAWARHRGHRMLETLWRCSRTDGTWDYPAFGYWEFAGLSPQGQEAGSANAGGDLTGSSGRLIEALVWFYEATGDSLALQLAERFVAYHLKNTLTEDGSIAAQIQAPSNPGHCHSYHGTLRGLLLYGLLTGEQTIVEAVERTYRVGLPSIVTESGWAPHDLGKARFNNERGDPVTDPASSGDSAQLALWLGLRAGFPRHLDDVERLVRARLLPGQLTEDDQEGNLADPFSARQLGGWGIHRYPHGGKGCILDVVAAVAHTLCDVQEHICTRSADGSEVRIHLHMNYADDTLSLTSERNQDARLDIHVRRQANLFIRVPGWVPQDMVRLAVNGQPIGATRVGSYLLIPGSEAVAGAKIELRYPLPMRHSRETSPSGTEYQFVWRGDEIIACDPSDNPLPFYRSAKTSGSSGLVVEEEIR